MRSSEGPGVAPVLGLLVPADATVPMTVVLVHPSSVAFSLGV